MLRKFKKLFSFLHFIRFTEFRLISLTVLFAILSTPQSALAQTGFWNLSLSPNGGTAGTDGTLYVTFSGSVNAVDANDAVAMVRIYEGSTMLRETTYVVGYNKLDIPINTIRSFAMGMPLGAGTHQLHAEAATINGGFSSQVFVINVQPSSTQPSVPPMPTGVTAMGGIGSITVQWNSVNNATSYSIQKTIASPVSMISNLIANIYVDSSVAQGTGYYYSVKACNNMGCSSWSPSTYATPNATAPIPTPSPTSGTSTSTASISALITVIDMLLNDTDESASTPTIPTPQLSGNYPGGSGGTVEVYEYNVIGRLINMTRNDVLNSHYEYDNAGNRKQVNY